MWSSVLLTVVVLQLGAEFVISAPDYATILPPPGWREIISRQVDNIDGPSDLLAPPVQGHTHSLEKRKEPDRPLSRLKRTFCHKCGGGGGGGYGGGGGGGGLPPKIVYVPVSGGCPSGNCGGGGYGGGGYGGGGYGGGGHYPSGGGGACSTGNCGGYTGYPSGGGGGSCPGGCPSGGGGSVSYSKSESSASSSSGSWGKK